MSGWLIAQRHCHLALGDKALLNVRCGTAGSVLMLPQFTLLPIWFALLSQTR